MFKIAFRAVVAGLIFGLIFFAGTAVWQVLCKSSIFTIDTVEVRGVVRTDANRLRAAYQPLVGKNIFDEISLDSALTNDDWVRRIEMKRVLPDKLVVLVEEEREVISYKTGDKCISQTESGKELSTDCATVRIEMAERPLDEEFEEFIGMYSSSELLKSSKITLENGFFLVYSDGVEIVGSYRPEVFSRNYDLFKDRIRTRYRSITSIDLTVKNKIYVKGVING
ncbi:MAG: FtsQ-type POTRA domain-containing protein [Deferribacteraceae bacterium]|jgi:hypothetical protein|nr:FtsQ-type POTRA domain-containing protein [Deferribacteraceae bacterium]